MGGGLPCYTVIIAIYLLMNFNSYIILLCVIHLIDNEQTGINNLSHSKLT